MYVILDQFEEYFLYHPAEAGEEPFADGLPGAVARRDLRVSFLVSIREDAVAKLDRFKGRIPNLFDNYLRIEHLDREAAREAIERPLERYNSLGPAGGPIEIEPELVDAVINDVEAGKLQVGQTGGAALPAGGTHARVEAPYLQLVMTRLWSEEVASGSRLLRLQTLERLGGAEGIVGTHLDAAMSALPPAERDIAARAFRYLVTRSRTKIAHSVSDLADWTAVPEAQLAPILATLAGGDARILRPVGESSFEIYHDVLAEAVLGWRANHEAQRRNEQERREAEARNRRRLMRVGAGVGLIGLVVAVVFAVFALSQRREARTERDRANREAEMASSRELAASAISQVKSHPDLSLLLARVAMQKHQTAEAAGALRQALLNTNADVVLSGHTDLVTSATFSPSGRRALTTSRDGTARVWDTATGRQVRILQRQAAAISEASFSPNGRLILTKSETDTVRVWNAATGRLLTTVHDVRLSPSFSRDSRLLLTTTYDSVELREATSGDVVTRLRGVEPNAEITGSRDGRLILAKEQLHDGGGPNQFPPSRVRVWKAATGQPVANLGRVSPFSERPIISQDSRLALTIGERGRLRVWKAATGQLVTTLGRVAPFSERPIISQDSRLVISTSERGTVRVWKAATGQLLTALRSAGVAALSPDGRLILTTSLRGTVRLWNTATGRLLKTVVRGQNGISAQFGPNAKLILTTSQRGTARLWSATGRPLATLHGLGRSAEAVFSNDGRLILLKSKDASPRIWDVPSSEEVVVLRVPEIPRKCRGGVYERSCRLTAVFSPDGALVLTAGGGARVAHLWNARSGSSAATLRGHREAVTSAAFSPSGQRVVTASRDHGARIWDTTSGREVAVLRGHRAPVRDAEFSRDGSLVVTASGDRTARVWRARTGRGLVVLRGHRRAVNSAAFSPDGRHVVTSADDHTARIWDTTTGRPVALLRPGRRPSFEDPFSWVPYSRATFSPNGSLVLAASSDGAARMWDVGPLGRLRTVLPRAVLLPKEGNLFNSVEFNRDGSVVVGASDDGTAYLWDPAESDLGTSLIHLSFYDSEVAQARFSPNGRLIVTAGDDGSARLWDVATKAEIPALRPAGSASPGARRLATMAAAS